MNNPDELFTEMLDALFGDRRAVFMDKLNELKLLLDDGGLMPNADSIQIRDFFCSISSDEVKANLYDLKEEISNLIDRLEGE